MCTDEPLAEIAPQDLQDGGASESHWRDSPIRPLVVPPDANRGCCGAAPPAACPLTPALLELLQAAVVQGDASDSLLAGALHRSPHTVKTEWKRLLAVLGVQSRLAAVLLALRCGWASLQADEPGDGA